MVRHFETKCDSLEPQDRIQNLALAEYLWRVDHLYSPFAGRRGNRISRSAIQNFSRAFPQLKQLICVKGRKVPFDGEEESGEYSENPGNYAGPSLVKSGDSLDLVSDPSLALDAVMSLFQAVALESGARSYPEVTVMEIRCS